MSASSVILFRGLNIGGVRAPAPALRAMAEDLGLARPQTLLASGNLIVETQRDPARLEAEIEAETEARFGRRIETIVRTGAQWAGLMAENPFPTQAHTDPARLLMMVMKAEVKPGGLEALQALAQGEERVIQTPGALWFWHPHGIGTSRMAEKAEPRLIGSGTARNWNTVVKISALVEGLEAA